jgi:hypothetical protein
MLRKVLFYLACVLAAFAFYAFIYLGMVVGCALDDQCFEMNTGYSAKEPRFAPSGLSR